MFHDAFYKNATFWNDMFNENDIEKIALDHHEYMAWWEGFMNTT